MLRFQASFRDEQRLQNKIEAIGEDLLAMLASVLYAERRTRIDGQTAVWELAEGFCVSAEQRIEQRLREFRHFFVHFAATTGRQALKGSYPTLSEGIILRRLDAYVRRKERP